MTIRHILTAVSAVCGLGLAAAAADEIKVGVIAPFSGPFAQYGIQYQQAVEAYQSQHGTSAGAHEISFIYKDVGGVNPDQSRALAQELLIRDRVDYLAGFTFTPNALAVGPGDHPVRDPHGDLQRRHLGDQQGEPVLPAHQLHAAAGLGPGGGLGL